MMHLEGFAHRYGCTLLTLDTLGECAAEQLYRSLGYTVASKISGYACLPNGSLADTSILYKATEPLNGC